MGLLLLNAILLTIALTALPALRGPRPLDRGGSLALTTVRGDVAATAPTWAPTLPPPVPAQTTPTTAGAPPAPARPLTRKEISDAALAMVKYPWKELGVHIAFLGPRAGYFGRAFPQANRIEMYVRPNETPTRLAYMLAHELGHIVDWRLNTPARRQAWRAARGIPASVSWFGNAFAGGDDLATPAGDFAETFAYWQIGPVDYKSRVGPPPTPEQLAALVPLFNR